MTTAPAPAPVVFCDVETTGLGPDDEIWEFAAVRRDPDGTESELHLFVEHSDKKCQRLPEAFRADHAARFPSACSGRVHTRRDTSREIRFLFRTDDDVPPPVVIGINPGFDLDHISRLMTAQYPAWTPPWHYTPVDARHLAVGALLAYPIKVLTGPTTAHTTPGGGVLHVFDEQVEFGTRLMGPPWGSEDVSRAIGVNPDDYERHTAMGDVRWAMAIYDAVVTRGGDQR